MKIISFSKGTVGALLAGEKQVTRREWADRHAKAFRDGEVVQAWNRSPRAGGKRVATLMLNGAPYAERALEMPDEDYGLEGFDWMEAHGYTEEVGLILADWEERNPLLWVVRFELVRVGPA